MFTGEKFNSNQCPRNEVKKSKMRDIPYASIMESLI